MRLEHYGMAEPGDCRVVFSASAEELAQAVAEERAAPDAPREEEDLMTAAVNRAILGGFSPLLEEMMRQGVVPLSDPDFELLAVSPESGFRAGAEFFCLPPLELGRYTGFTQAVRPRPIRKLTIELEINRRYGDAERAADAEGKRALREQVTRELYQKRCEQARSLAEQELLFQLGAEVRGPLPKQLVAGNYFAEQRQFNLRMQANGINFDQYLAVQGQTVEQFRAALHAQAEQKLRSRLGLLLVADRETLWPSDEELTAALARWEESRDGARTFPANDARKMRQKLAAARAAAFVLAHSSLTPPPQEPVVEEGA